LLSSERSYSKKEFVERLQKIKEMGWIPRKRSKHNVGAVGNILEDLMDIRENNLPIANAGTWELKAQRYETSSFVTLFHFEPWPRIARIVPRVFLPKYGWPHATERNEMSFRVTMSGDRCTDRGFKVFVDRTQQRLRIDFDVTQVASHHAGCLEQVRQRVGLGKIEPEPYWVFSELEKKARPKLQNSFYVIAKNTNRRRQREVSLRQSLNASEL
jgi:hypothetical protein